MSELLSYLEPISKRADEIFYQKSLKTALEAFLPDHTMDIDKDLYKILITSILGYTPTDAEAGVIFENRNHITLEIFKSVLNNLVSLNYQCYHDVTKEVYVALDCNYKGCIDINDFRKAWEEIDCKLPWKVVLECFEEVASEDDLSYMDLEDLRSG